MVLTKGQRFVLLVEYEGRRYYGFQWQAGLPTIQAELEKAIKRLCPGSSRVMAASRTDTGVHARGQVVSFWAASKLDTNTLVKAINYYLPQDIVVRKAYRVASGFNVRRDAISREYCYYILNNDVPSPFCSRFALFIPKVLNISLMEEACQLLKGRHDFISFVSSLNGVNHTVRDIYEAEVNKTGNLVIFRLVANSFLPHQVRNTAGLLTRLGKGKIGIEEFHNVLQARKVGLAGPRMAAHGLWLTKVNYAKPLESRDEDLYS
jgi:tRNA pseudouridine38-40 synthase